MAKGSFTVTGVSTEIVPADEHREYLCIQSADDKNFSIGVGEAAVNGEGLTVYTMGGSIRLRGAQARRAIYAIGNGASGGWQDGEVNHVPGSHKVS